MPVIPRARVPGMQNVGQYMHGRLHHQLGGMFGMPATVALNRGVHFTSVLWMGACTSLDSKQLLTTAYHPQSYGMVERLQRQIQDALCEGPTWHFHLPWVLMGLLAAPKEDSAVPSAELANSSPLIIPGQLLQMSDPPCVYVPPLPMRPASYAAVANTSLAHLAEVGHVYMQIGGHQKPLVAP